MKLTYKEKLKMWSERRAEIYKMYFEQNLSFNDIGKLQKPPITGQQVKHLIDKHIKSYEKANLNTSES